MAQEDLKVPEAKTVGGNPGRANWAAAFAKMASNGTLQTGGATSDPSAQITASYNPGGVERLGAATMSKIADATTKIFAQVAGLGNDRPQLAAATGAGVIEVQSEKKIPNGVEKVEKIPTTAFDTIDRLAKQIDSELFMDETMTADQLVQSLVSELEGIYEDFDKLALEEVKPIFQEHNYIMAGSVKYRLQDDILPKIEKFIAKLDQIDFGSCDKCNITKDDILVRVEQLQEYVETVLEGVINKEAEYKQQQELNNIANGDCGCGPDDKCESGQTCC